MVMFERHRHVDEIGGGGERPEQADVALIAAPLSVGAQVWDRAQAYITGAA